jgi:hypothetical protein
MNKHLISLKEAKALTNRYRENIDKLTSPEYSGVLPFSETFDAAAIKEILNQPDCVSFRTYFGMNEDKTVCIIHIGVDAEGNDIINSLNGKGEDVIMEFGKPCPPYCNANLL